MIKVVLRKFFGGIKGVIRHLRRVLLDARIIRKYDFDLPLKGKIMVDGFYEDTLSKRNVRVLKSFNPKTNIFDSSISDVLNEIFSKIYPQVASYLGNEFRIDGIKTLETNYNSESSSNSWHTDNVGNRLKVFVCFEGDGSQPTSIIPNTHKLNYGFNKYTFEEIIRWFNIKNLSDKNNEILLRHREGSIFVFDTNSFHRGCYEKSPKKRKVLIIELANKFKSDYLRKNLSLPIGPDASNSFVLGRAFSKNFKYSSILDSNLMFLKGNKEFYGVENV